MLSDVHFFFVSRRIKCFNCQGLGHSYKECTSPHFQKGAAVVGAAAVAAVVAKEKTGTATTAARAVPQIADIILLYNFFSF